MTILHLLLISSAVSWLLLIGLAVSVVRIEKAVVAMQAEEQDGPAVGSVAPELANDEGTGSVSVGPVSAPGLPRLVWFMRSGCRPCQLARPLVEAIASEYQENVTCWVNYAGTPEAAEEFGREWGSTVNLVPDPDQTNQTRWKIRRVPSVVLVGRDGAVAWKGAVSRKTIEEALNGLEIDRSARLGRTSGIGG